MLCVFFRQEATTTRIPTFLRLAASLCCFSKTRLSPELLLCSGSMPGAQCRKEHVNVICVCLGTQRPYLRKGEVQGTIEHDTVVVEGRSLRERVTCALFFRTRMERRRRREKRVAQFRTFHPIGQPMGHQGWILGIEPVITP